jgi:hypothetical protein
LYLLKYLTFKSETQQRCRQIKDIISRQPHESTLQRSKKLCDIWKQNSITLVMNISFFQAIKASQCHMKPPSLTAISNCGKDVSSNWFYPPHFPSNFYLVCNYSFFRFYSICKLLNWFFNVISDISMFHFYGKHLCPWFCNKRVLLLTHTLILNVCLLTCMHSLHMKTQHLVKTLEPLNWIRVRPFCHYKHSQEH